MPREPDFEGFLKPGSRAAQLVETIDMERRPRHIAIIMDGSGRWAGARRMRRVLGHRAASEAVRDSVETSARLGLDLLTLYAFSRENWKRPQDEVSTLMGLLREFVRKEMATLQANDIRFRPIGRLTDLPEEVRADLDWAVEETSGNGGLVLQIALSYGGRDEIADAVRLLAEDLEAGRLSRGEISQEAIAARLYTAGGPDPDLLIRTGGEMRVSNFLLWQIAYTEIYVTDVLWPDFRREHLLEAVLDFQTRQRRFGGVINVPAGKEQA
jgi:undecaprenyl diphosphate synthase